jgi:hypothetical protein
MIVRSRLPWPLRWAAVAVMFGFRLRWRCGPSSSASSLPGWSSGAKEELATLAHRTDAFARRTRAGQAGRQHRGEPAQGRTHGPGKLALQLRQLEADKLTLQSELGFFQKLLPTGAEGIQLRGLQAEAKAPGELRYQMLVVQNGKDSADFNGRYELQLAGSLEGRAWVQTLPGGPRVLQVKQVARVEGQVEHPAAAVIKTVQVRVLDAKGVMRATHTTRL